MRSDSDLSTPARIRDAALARFGTDGFAATSVRTIASDAGVSPALILHHFGSKDGLREACDGHVFAFFQRTAGRAGQSQTREHMITDEAMTLLRYLMRQASEDSAWANTMVAQVIEMTKEGLAARTERGDIRPTADPDMRAALLVMLRLGPLLFSGAIERATGADVLTADGLQRMYSTILEILRTGIYTGPHPDVEEDPFELGRYLGSDPGPTDHDSRLTTGGRN